LKAVGDMTSIGNNKVIVSSCNCDAGIDFKKCDLLQVILPTVHHSLQSSAAALFIFSSESHISVCINQPPLSPLSDSESTSFSLILDLISCKIIKFCAI
jgi:hypothetical protein